MEVLQQLWKRKGNFLGLVEVGSPRFRIPGSRIFPEIEEAGSSLNSLYRERSFVLCRLMINLRFGCGTYRSIDLVEKRQMVPLMKKEIDILSPVPVSRLAERGSGTRSRTPGSPFFIGPTVVSGLAPSSGRQSQEALKNRT